MIRSLIHIPCISHAANLIYEEIITLAEFKPYFEEIDDLIDEIKILKRSMQN